MKKVVILGAGMVGSAIAADLSKDYNVISADKEEKKLKLIEQNYSIKTIQIDISNKNELEKAVADSDLVIGAVPGFMGFETLKKIINTGKNVVDISFFNEDPFKLDQLAKEKNVIAIVDCGVAPGMSNIILGYYNKRMSIDSFECYVGGLPFKRTMPFQYKAPFSPIDVIEEYTRPARIMENNKVVIRAALSEPELIEFNPVGTLEAFNTDGLRSLLKTMNIPNMKEKTLRYPGHIEHMKFLKESGFFSDKEINVKGINIKPVEFTAKLLFPKWKLEQDEPEFTVLKIIIRGSENNEPKEYSYYMFDRFDEETKISSMARTTGYTCTAAARLVLNGDYIKKGISPPEYLGEDEKCFNKILEDLKAHKIDLYKN